MAARKPTKSLRPKKAVRSELHFDEISNGHRFEDLVADYFRRNKKQSNIIDVAVQASGEGTDGGRDILLTFEITDSIISFQRKWVVQCKFRAKAVSNADLSTVNIPTLIHEYKANGYLLVCRGNVTSNVSKMFENLEERCKMGYSYVIWTGSQFTTHLNVQPPRPLIKTYFPEYYEFTQSRRRRVKPT